MKFIPNLNVEKRERRSCIWSVSEQGYIITSSSVEIGTLIVDTDTGLTLKNGDKKPLEYVGIDYEKFGTTAKEIEANHYVDGYNIADTTSMSMSLEFQKPRNELPFGVFKLVESRSGFKYVPYNILENKQTLVKNKTLKNDVLDFFKNPTEGRKNKKGILLFGPPGNGKTTEIMSLFDICKDIEVRIIIIDSQVNLGWLDAHQEVLGKDRTIFIIEEITERVSGRSIEHLLTFLDGENSWTNSVTIATTNYPEDLPSNLIDRPGRFETFIEYSNPTNQEVQTLVEAFGLIADETYTSLQGEGFSFDYVSFILSKAKKNNLSIKETIATEREKRRKISETFKGKIGIG